MIRRFTQLVLVAILAVSSAAMAAETVELPSEVTIFKNVNVFNGTDNKLIKGCNVVVENNLIQNTCAKNVAPAKGATVIDGKGMTLMPGLIDSHVHLNLTGLFQTLNGAEYSNWDEIGAMAAANARDYLMDGYTTVRDTCGLGTGLKKLIDKGVLPGPRIYSSAACISPTSGHGDWRSPINRIAGSANSNVEKLGMVILVDNPDEMTEAVRRNLSMGASQIKLTAGGGISSELDPLYSVGFTPEELKAAVTAAAYFDTYVLVHAYTDETIEMALDAGVKVIEHGQMITEKTMKRLVKEGLFFSLNTAGFSPILFEHPNFAKGTYVGDKLQTAHDGAKDLIKLVKKYKPKLVHNVDSVLQTIEQARAHRDFEKYQFSDWFGNYAMLKSATSTGGELAQLTGKRNPYPGTLGVIEKGAYADILIVDGNPLKDLSVLGAHSRWFDAKPRGEGIDTIKVIMKDGKIYKNTL